MEQKQFIRYELALDSVSRAKAILTKGLQEIGFRSEAQKLKPIMIFFQKLWNSNLKTFKDKPEQIEIIVSICSNIVKTNKSLGNMSFYDTLLYKNFLDAKAVIERMPK